MSSLLTDYENRLLIREVNPNDQATYPMKIDLEHIKFSSNGKIKPYYGLTCITWINRKSDLYQELCTVQSSIQAELSKKGIGQIFFFLEPTSFHMTICDITARPIALDSTEIQRGCDQVLRAFSKEPKMDTVTSYVQGLGLKSTITALVRFKQESELQKVLHLEREIKQATRVNLRNFLGHITLAYCVTPPDAELEIILRILHSYHDHFFGEFPFSEFDLTYFTDMNTFIPLVTINFEDSQITNHPIKFKDKLEIF